MTTPPTPGFYADALADADRLALHDAALVKGLIQEIALLRVKLRDTLREDPSNWPAYLDHVKHLTEALLAQQKLATEDSRDLSEAVGALLGDFATALHGYNPGAPLDTQETA